MMDRQKCYSLWGESTGGEFNPHSLENLSLLIPESVEDSEKQTNEVFSDKWSEYEQTENKEVWYQMQRDWYLMLYGFSEVADLQAFLRSKKIIFDAGCGLAHSLTNLGKRLRKAIAGGEVFVNALKFGSTEALVLPSSKAQHALRLQLVIGPASHAHDVLLS